MKEEVVVELSPLVELVVSELLFSPPPGAVVEDSMVSEDELLVVASSDSEEAVVEAALVSAVVDEVGDSSVDSVVDEEVVALVDGDTGAFEVDVGEGWGISDGSGQSTGLTRETTTFSASAPSIVTKPSLRFSDGSTVQRN